MKIKQTTAILAAAAMLLTAAACNNGTETTTTTTAPAANDDAAVTDAAQPTDDAAAPEATNGIAKDKIKVGVIHIGDPADGSGYSYTHDLGIQGMQANLGLNDDQIVRKINISDSDTAATKTAIEECVAEGCNIIFTTSYG